MGCALVVAIGIAIRINNAFLYPIDYGFDAPANWEYVARLLDSWALPAPDSGWSTAHPPFFYYLAAALGRLMGGAGKTEIVVAVRLLSSAIGVVGVLAVAWFVSRADPGGDPERGPRRVFIALASLLLLPVHVYMSAMLGEEILAAALTSIALVGAASVLTRPGRPRAALWKMAGLGVVAGLAFLTKLTGLLVIVAVALAFGLDGLRRGRLPEAIARVVVFGLVAVTIGAWPYVRNRIEYGYFYPQSLAVHEIMFSMPPGERSVTDYFRFPLATFSDPPVIAPEMLHSVWGTTYLTLWFDGHRVILPRSEIRVRRVGTLMLLLGLLPTLAFAAGLGRGVRRAVESPGGPDTLMIAIVVLTLAGYVLFTWKNPWYATLKGSYMLGIAAPFALYTSEALADWGKPPPAWRATIVWLALAALLTTSALTFTVNLVYTKREGPGFVWPKVDPSRHFRDAIPRGGRATMRP